MNKCETCTYWQPPAKGVAAGNCHVKAPSVFMVPVKTLQGDGLGFQSVFPPTMPNEWCAMHSRGIEGVPLLS